MKNKFVLLATALLISVSSFAQKDELKNLKKLYTKDAPSAKDVIDYKANVVKLTPLASEEGDRIYANFYKAMTPVMEIKALGPAATPEQMAKFITPTVVSEFTLAANAMLDYEKRTGKKVYTDNINQTVAFYKPTLLNYAVTLGNQKKNSEAASVLHNLYLLDKKDQEKLYYAASYAVNAQDYDTALKYYEELKTLNFSGEKTLYAAVSKLNDKVEYFDNKANRDAAIKIGTHITPSEEKEPSKRGEIYKNIALILVQKGKIEEAKKAIVDARQANPDDNSLLLSEADLYLKTNDMEAYKTAINQVLEKDPNNVDLIFNLGVISNNNKDPKGAEKYYLRAIEINPNYANAYYNLSALKIDESQVLLDQMNKLGTSAADNKKYEALKKQRDAILLLVVSHLEKTVSLDDKNTAAKTTLVSVYNALEMTDKAKALKATIKE
ncbi:tetratricopeptide (TPR) repeat protein [Flavobacterium arsenatis]|uniref:Tetratricopeptide (TPR) repeat protein n=1 Tax=Flavobacterium arsenatis TaxID=1484332 RepID=A0ABU1TQ86_9FLAO|nr:tetratricopeptide repeat protein [Flavobacterium arsenatis]MDR6968066.1 tetratricopeptide (TPR) repeat protein [Flavobacterium arsenatis]